MFRIDIGGFAVVSAKTNQVVGTFLLPLGSEPFFLQFSPDGRTLYIDDTILNEVDIVSTTRYLIPAALSHREPHPKWR
jgi:hypothetical protein